jgi:hypothetical protein
MMDRDVRYIRDLTGFTFPANMHVSTELRTGASPT